MRISDWSSDVCSSDLVAAVEHEAARRLDRTAEEDRLVEWFVMFDLELVEHGADGHPVDRIVDTDPHRAILVMADHRDHRMLETRIADTRQREQQLAGEPGGGTLQLPTMRRHAPRAQPLSTETGRAACR